MTATRRKRLSRKLVRSTKRWAASVMTARLPTMCPPYGIQNRKWGWAPLGHDPMCTNHSLVKTPQTHRAEDERVLTWI